MGFTGLGHLTLPGLLEENPQTTKNAWKLQALSFACPSLKPPFKFLMFLKGLNKALKGLNKTLEGLNDAIN